MSIICPSGLLAAIKPFSYRISIVGKISYLCNIIAIPFAFSVAIKAFFPYIFQFLIDNTFAVLFDVPAEQLREDIADRSTEVSKRYHKGKAASKVKLLHQEMQLAYVGSPLALENAQKNLMDMEDDE